MTDIERFTLIASLIAGVVNIFIQIWQRFDEFKQQKSQIDLEYKRFNTEEKRSTSDIDQQQSEIHLRLTEGLRTELENTNSRLRALIADFDEFKRKSDEMDNAISILFDDLECLFTEYNETNAAEMIKKIRKFRRVYSV